MGILRSALLRGPAYLGYNSSTIEVLDDLKVEEVLKTSEVLSALRGKINESITDRAIKVTGTPLLWTALSVLFPYVSPTRGQRIFGGGTDTDIPLTIRAINGDLITLTNAAVTKMPDLELGGEKDIIGPVEFTGLVASGDDPATTGSYYTQATGQSFTFPATDQTKLTRQYYTASWGSVSGFGAFEAETTWKITHELGLVPVVNGGGTTVDYTIDFYRVRATCVPEGPTSAQIKAALALEGEVGALVTAVNSPDLVITGQNLVSITLKNAALVKAGRMFGGKPLRNGELQWVSTYASAASPVQGAVIS